MEVRGKIAVLLVDRTPAELAPARAALEDSGMKVTVADKDGFARGRRISRRSTWCCSATCPWKTSARTAPHCCATYTRNGGGLLMAGGPKSFGAGGYYKTAVEEVLPVYMDPYREPVTQAVVLILDKSWSMGDMAGSKASKIDMIREAAIATSAG